MDNHVAVMLAQQINAHAEMMARVEGMKAENKRREYIGEGPTYIQCHFDDLTNQLACHHSARCDLGRI